MQAQDTATAPQRTTRHHCVDEDFLTILEKDFGIDEFALRRVFLVGIPAPKREAIELCEWAATKDDPERALRNWAKKHGRSAYDRRTQDPEPPTWNGRAHYEMAGV